LYNHSMKKIYLLFLLIVLSPSCSTPLFATATPTQTPTRIPTATSTNTPSPTSTPTPYPTLDVSFYSPAVQEFLNRYGSFEEAVSKFRTDYSNWDYYHEPNGLPIGNMTASPTFALEKRAGDCFEMSVIWALFGEKMGYYPYILNMSQKLDSGIVGHFIYIYQDKDSKKWGYIDGPVLLEPTYKGLADLITYYVTNWTFSPGKPVTWYKIDLNKMAEVYPGNRNWRTGEEVLAGAKTFVDNGQYTP